jgi:uncharacterized protein (DUF1697 family)
MRIFYEGSAQLKNCRKVKIPMTTCIALLRGINVAGRKRVRMQDVAAAFTALQCTPVRTFLQSGNVVFETASMEPDRLTALLEERIRAMTGFPVRVLLRTVQDFQHIVENNPFLYPDGPDPRTLHVTFLSAMPSPDRVEAVQEITDPADRCAVAGKEVYLFCPNGYGKTVFSNAFFERRLSVIATTRNWNTVTLLSEAEKGQV